MKVFEDLRDAFRQAVRNFKEELNRDQVTDSVEGLLAEMRNEVVDARAYVHRLERDLRRTLRQTEAEGEEAAVCRRRESLARRIQDTETARVAREFAEKHEARKAVLERKAAALQEELDLRRDEVSEMIDRLKAARNRREELRAGAGRSSAREAVRSGDLFEELDRMSEKIDASSRFTAAAEEVDGLFMEREEKPDDASTDPASDLDERLAELKRRMDRGRREGGGGGADSAG